MQKVETKRLPELVQRVLGWGLNIIISIYIVLILAVMPLYHQEGFVHIGTDKSTFLRVCSTNIAKILVPVFLLYVLLTLILKIRKKRLFQAVKEIRFSVTEYFMLAYIASVLLSHMLSPYRDLTWRGQEGWYMGTATQLVLVTSFFLIGRVWNRNKWLLLPAFLTSAAVFALGVLNRFGIFPIDMQIDNVMFISTIGNINWYCGYMMSVFFGGFALLWQSDGWHLWQKSLLGAYVAIGFASLVTQGSSSGLLTLLIVLFVTFCLSVSDGRRMYMFCVELVIFSAVCLLISLVRRSGWGTITYIEAVTEPLTNSNLPIVMTAVSVSALCWLHYTVYRRRYPEKVFRALAGDSCAGVAALIIVYVVVLVINTVTDGGIIHVTEGSYSELLTFSSTWGNGRGATWTAGVLCFQEQNLLHKLFGVGPDGMASFLYTDGSERLLGFVRDAFGGNRLTNAHNEWLTILVNMGVLGFVSYVGMMVTAIRRFLGQSGKNRIVAACGFCLFAYTVNNMFSFQQAMNASTIFIVLGVGENYLRER